WPSHVSIAGGQLTYPQHSATVGLTTRTDHSRFPLSRQPRDHEEPNDTLDDGSLRLDDGCDVFLPRVRPPAEHPGEECGRERPLHRRARRTADVYQRARRGVDAARY